MNIHKTYTTEIREDILSSFVNKSISVSLCRADPNIFTQRDNISSFLGHQWYILFLTRC
jgi:hypothetical protein